MTDREASDALPTDGGDSRSLVVSALGGSIRIDVADGVSAEFLQRIRTAWAEAVCTECESPDRTIVVTPQHASNPDACLSDLSMRVTLEAIEHARGQRLLLHACGVAGSHGRVVAFVGPSGRGKTTAARVLSQSFAYVTDETVAIDADLRVHAYRKPLSVKTGPGPVKEQHTPVADRERDHDRLSLAAVLLLDRDENHSGPPRIRPVDPAAAIAELVPQISYLTDLPRPLHFVAAILHAVGGARRLVYREATDLPQLVAQAFSPPAATWTWRTASAGDLPGGIDDAIVIGDKVVVLRNRIVSVLDGIAPTIWQALSDSPSLDELVATVVAHHGAPPHGDATDAVQAALDDLRAAELIIGPSR